jgi:helicase SWR1
MDRCNRLRCSMPAPILSAETILRARSMIDPLFPLSELDQRRCYLSTLSATHGLVLSNLDRAAQMQELIDRFACTTPSVVAVDLPQIALAGAAHNIFASADPNLSTFQILHQPSVKLQIAFPDSSLLQYDCGKLQELHRLLRERKAGGHRVLLFTQMTKVLDIIESFLNLHGYLYLRLDGSTKIEDRQYITERFNSDSRIFCFISSSRSGGVGIKYVFPLCL